MSHSKSEHSGKSSTTSSPMIAFRFRSGDEELEELEIDDHESDTGSLRIESEDKSGSANETTPVKEYWNLLGKRSTSVDSGCADAPNSDPWRKFNELKGKLTKTVEEKISEIKIERNKSAAGNVLGISSNRARLVNSSKDNSSISDSEDTTSESSRLSESLKESAAEENVSPKKKNHHKSDTIGSFIDTVLENIKPATEVATGTEPADDKTDPRRLSEVVKLSEIKISTAEIESESTHAATPGGEVESGIEADENFSSRQENDERDETDENVPPTRNASPTAGRRWLPPFFHDRSIFNLASVLKAKKAELIALAVAMLLYHVFPLTPFLKGLLTGMVLVLAGNYIYVASGFSGKKDEVPFKIPVYELLKPLAVPRQTASSVGVWFNEYMKEYDPDMYSVTQTVPVYLEINDCYLKLSRPKGKINKRATFDEPEYKLVFLNHRLYNITGCSVLLLPEGLTKKRLYSKKYPIVIMLKPDSLVTEKTKEKDLYAEEETDPENTETDDTLSQSHESAYGRLYLNLFARCDRQKEEWYRKLLAATKVKVTPDKPEKQNWSVDFDKMEEVGSAPEQGNDEPSTPFESIYFDDEEAKYEEYLRYMTQFVDMEMQRPEIFPLKKVPVSLFKKLSKKKKATVPKQTPESFAKPRRISTSKSWPTTPGETAKEEPGNGEDRQQQQQQQQKQLQQQQTQWFNAFVNRILFDVFRSPYWLEQIRIKMEKKLNSIRMPYYVEDIEIVELDLGKMGPRFHRISCPVLDDRGLWFDMDMTFDGLVKVTIQTQLNLIKLQKGIEQSEEEETAAPPAAVQEKPTEEKLKGEKKSKKKVRIKVEKKILWEKDEEKAILPDFPEKEEPDRKEEKEIEETRSVPEKESCIAELVDIAFDEDETPEETYSVRSPMYDSELEDSAESSDDDEDEEEETQSQSSTTVEETVSESVSSPHKKHVPMRRSSKKLFRIFENVAQSKYFKSVAQSKYIQKAIAGVSRTKLKLSLEIKGCVGTVAVNIPPPPSDRLWYGFREMPKVWLSAQPKIGEKHVRISHIKNFLEKKIMQEFKKVMVFPNMDDVILPTYPQVFPWAPTPQEVQPDAATNEIINQI